MFNFLALLDIRVFGRLYNHCGSDWPRTFFTPKVFLFSIFDIRIDTFVWINSNVINLSVHQLLKSYIQGTLNLVNSLVILRYLLP